MAQLLIDNREHGLMKELTAIGLPFTIATLDVGDIMIQNAEGEPLLVAERKSHADFAASNQDGRYREQRARLMAVRGSGVAVLYILEGTWTTNIDRVFGGRTTESTLQRLTTRLILRYGMPVLATAGIAETARWCRRLFEQLTDDPTAFHPEGLAAETAGAMATYTATFSTAKKGNKDASGVAHAMLSAIPGLGGKRVGSLLEQKSVSDLVAMSAAEIGTIVAGGKKLGEKLGTTIWDALHHQG
jgi:ERCC4-type nuclease